MTTPKKKAAPKARTARKPKAAPKAAPASAPKGYTVGKWGAHVAYTCDRCAHTTLHLANIIPHAAECRRTSKG